MEQIIKYFTEVCIKNFEKIQEDFFKDPQKLAEFVGNIEDECRNMGLEFLKETLEGMDMMLRNNLKRKMDWHVERNDNKELITSMGKVRFRKTLFASKTEKDDDGKQVMAYLLDKAIGLEENQRLTEDAVARVYEEAVQTSYRRGGENICSGDRITKSAVKELLHKTKFPPNFTAPEKKKELENIYIDADEDHYSLQFQKKKGDLDVSERGYKLNGAITKMAYVYEGVEPVAPGSKRHRLVNPHYFLRGDGTNKEFWEEVYEYLDATYDLSKVKRIYLNADGGAWIKAGVNYIDGITYVLDEFHLSKYISKMTGHMKDSRQDSRSELCEAIRSKDKEEFRGIVKKLKDCTDSEAVHAKIDYAAEYILSNWNAAKRRLWKRDGVEACSAEGHVYHALSSRMSTLPMGWSRRGACQMARLREWHLNGGGMLELARYQKKQLPMAAGAENDIISAHQMLSSEIDRRPKSVRETAKYSDAISHTLAAQASKKGAYYANHWISGI